MENRTWYEANTGNHQGLIIEEETGKNIAVSYDKEDARLIAAAPDLLEACKQISNALYAMNARKLGLEFEHDLLITAIAKAERGEK